MAELIWPLWIAIVSWAMADEGRLIPMPSIRLGSICNGGVIVKTKAGMPMLIALAKPMWAAPMTIIMVSANTMPPMAPQRAPGTARARTTSDALPERFVGLNVRLAVWVLIEPLSLLTNDASRQFHWC